MLALWHNFVMSCDQVYYGLLKEPEIELPLDDEDEEAENEEGKPKKKKPKKDSMGSKSKKQDPNAPAQTRYSFESLLFNHRFTFHYFTLGFHSVTIFFSYPGYLYQN